MLKHGADPEPLYQIYKSVILRDSAPPTPVKLLFIGHSGAGKTTLIQSLRNESCIEVVRTTTKGHTAGVIPTNFVSQKYGAVTMYDFAGQPEYYASHDAVLYAAVTNIPPVVLILFNLHNSNQKIKGQIHFWIQFIANRCSKLTNNAHVIIIGSHAHELQSKKKDPAQKLKQVQTSFKEEFLEKPLTLKCVMHMDCTLSQSAEISKLHKILEHSVNELRETGTIQFTVHCFYALLINTFKEKVTIHITDDTLDWIILKQVKLLHDVLGSLFAPSNFPQHYPLSYSTGVVPLSRIEKYYDEYDPNMLLTFLIRMEYCRKITVLECIVSDEETFENDEYFFFSHLVSLETY